MKAGITTAIREWFATQDGPRSREEIRAGIGDPKGRKSLDAFNHMLRDGMLKAVDGGYTIGRLPKKLYSADELHKRRVERDRIRKARARLKAGMEPRAATRSKSGSAPVLRLEKGWPEMYLPSHQPMKAPAPPMSSSQWEAQGFGKIERLPAAWD